MKLDARLEALLAMPDRFATAEALAKLGIVKPGTAGATTQANTTGLPADLQAPAIIGCVEDSGGDAVAMIEMGTDQFPSIRLLLDTAMLDDRRKVEVRHPPPRSRGARPAARLLRRTAYLEPRPWPTVISRTPLHPAALPGEEMTRFRRRREMRARSPGLSKGDTIQQNAVIYARVSSVQQKTQGHGLESQETRCREFATYKGYRVVNVFRDDASGSLVGRPGMIEMLAFLKKQKSPHFVIIDDISRLARSLEAHLQLRNAISSANGILQSPSIEFGEDSDSQLVENLLASVSQHQRQKKCQSDQEPDAGTSTNGYWCFPAPIGYRFERVSGHGKMLVKDEPLASILKEGFEGYASGRFQTQPEVMRFFQSRPEWPTNRRTSLTTERCARC